MRVFRPSYKGRDGGKHKTAKLYLEFKDHLQLTRRLPAFADRRLSESLGRQIEKLVACKISGEQPDAQLSRWLECIPAKMREKFVSIGLIDSSRAAAGKLLLEHIADFEQSLIDKGNTRKQAQMTVSRVTCIAKEGRFATWTDIAASKVQRCIAKMQENGLGKKTANYYLRAFQHFARWMVDDRRATTSPVGHLRAIEVQKRDIRRERRALEPDEVRRLLEATAASGVRFGLTGYERAMIYRLACESGLRANELRLLKVANFDFDNRTVTVQDHTSKNRKEKTLPLRPDTAAQIRELLAKKLPDAQAFKVPGKPIDMFRPDLEAAGIDYVDDAGRYCDFHSLRHTTGSLLAASGCHPKVAQSIMRHSDINLTLSRYTHTLTGQEADAVNRLPDFSRPSSQRQRKTGTDDSNVTGGNVLALRLALSGAGQRPTMPSTEKANPAYGIETPILDRARLDSNQQPSDSKSATLSN